MRRGPGRPGDVTDAGLVCPAVARVLLRYDNERHRLRAAPALAGHLFPRLLRQSQDSERLKDASALLETALRWLADHTPGTAEQLRLMDATPVPCGQSAVTAKRSSLCGHAGYGYCASPSRYCRGARLMLIVTCDGTVTGFGLASPRLTGEREEIQQLLTAQPARRPRRGTAIVADKGFSGDDFEEFLASLGLDLTRPARKDDKKPRHFPNWPRQRAEAIIGTLQSQLGLERHRGRAPAGLRRAAPAGAERGDLAQLDDRRAGQAVPDRLRPQDLVTSADSPVTDPGGTAASTRASFASS